MQKQLKGVFVGAGYFSQFHLDAWDRIPQVEITAGFDLDNEKIKSLASQYHFTNDYTSVREMLEKESPDFIDIITPPETHLSLCELASQFGVAIICQKPVAPSFNEAINLFELMDKSRSRFMVHDNWRFQPWYRKIKLLLEEETIGKFHTVYHQMRMGDGWGSEAYLGRQPYFRKMERLLIFETGVHFIDTFRYLFGEIGQVYSRLRTLNPVIQGEDTAWVQFDFINGGLGLLDSGRYNEPLAEDPRFTFGEMLVEGEKGSIRLYSNGEIGLKLLGQHEKMVNYVYSNQGFCGDSVFHCLTHFVTCLINDLPFETSAEDYQRTLLVQEAVYQSSKEAQAVKLT